MARLGVNIDHVATLRNVRGATFPCPVRAARIAEEYGADGITAHLREDRRHIRDDDIRNLRREIKTRLNMEMANTTEMLDIALEVKPDMVTLVPERREELTTEGGLDAVRFKEALMPTVQALLNAGIEVSLFIEPSIEQVDATVQVGAGIIEFHTGKYCNLFGSSVADAELEAMKTAADHCVSRNIRVNAGHGLNYDNVGPILSLAGLDELNIGHFLVCESIYTGLGPAVRKMKDIIS